MYMRSRKVLKCHSTMLKKIAFLPDCHRPYHSKPGWELFMDSMLWWKPDILVVLGDFGDCYAVSSFSKNPQREHSFVEEVEDCNAGLDELDSLFSSRKIFIEGNHEDRLRRYLCTKAPELFGTTDIARLYNLHERGYEFVPYKESTRLGKLWITHDVGTAGRYSVFRAADTFQHPVVMAHTHRLVYVVEGNATGESFPAVQFGWLGDVEQVDYMHKAVARRAWTLAFGTGMFDEETGLIYLTPVPIVVHEGTYSCLVEGKRFVA